MAPYAIATGSVQAVKVWSKLLMLEVIHKTVYGRYASSSGNMPFQIITDLTKGAGDQVKFDLLMQMTDYGKNKNDAIEGYESNLVYHQETINIEQKRFAHAWYRMAQQRTIHQLRRDAMQNIRDRWAAVLDLYLMAFLAGTSGELSATLGADITDHGAEALASPDANHLITDYTAAQFSPACIDDARWAAEQGGTTTAGVPIRKIPIAPGLEGYVMFIHPASAKNLQQDSDWLANVRYADVRGSKNRLWTGAMGIYNDVLIVPSHYVMSDTTVTDQRYNVLVGAQAAVVAFGNAFDVLDQQRYGKEFVFSWVERTGSNDYGNIKGVSGGSIFGVQATTFNSARYASIRVETRDTM